MQGKMRFTYLGINQFNGKKDPTKVFHSVSLLQGSEVANIFLEAGTEIWFEKLKKFDEFESMVSWGIKTNQYGAKIEYKILTAPEMMESEIPEGFDNLPEEKVTDINLAAEKKSKTA